MLLLSVEPWAAAPRHAVARPCAAGCGAGGKDGRCARA